MHVTVAICTWNRCQLLEETLSRLESLRRDRVEQLNILVVNNNSTDDTSDVISKFASRLPVRELVETKQGHCHARNCAIEHASGDWIVWTDDDVLVDESWLVEYAKAIERFPNADFAGGTIDPWFASTPPAWMSNHLDLLQGPFAIRQLGDDVRVLQANETVYGANMAFRLSVLKQNRFDPTFGLVGDNAVRGDEADVIRRLREKGSQGIWVGPAKVQHYIPPERLTKAYVKKFAFGYGQTIARLDPDGGNVPKLFGRPRWLVKRFLKSRIAEIAHGPLRNRTWLAGLQDAQVCLGMMDTYSASGSANVG